MRSSLIENRGIEKESEGATDGQGSSTVIVSDSGLEHAVSYWFILWSVEAPSARFFGRGIHFKSFLAEPLNQNQGSIVRTFVRRFRVTPKRESFFEGASE